jgi:hypothetical protein
MVKSIIEYVSNRQYKGAFDFKYADITIICRTKEDLDAALKNLNEFIKNNSVFTFSDSPAIEEGSKKISYFDSIRINNPDEYEQLHLADYE